MFDNRQWIIGGIGFLTILIYYFAVWEAVGRDPKSGAIIPLFHPPDGISPALANYVHNWGLGREKWRAFTAAALSLAVRGLVLFDNKGGALTLRRTGKQPAGGFTSLPPGEGAIFTWLDSEAGFATIDKAHGAAVAVVGDKFKSAIETQSRNHFFRRNLGYVIAGVAMTAAVVAGIVAFGGLHDQDIAILFGLCFGGFMLGIFAVPLLQSLFGDGAKFAVLVARRHVDRLCRHLHFDHIQFDARNPAQPHAARLPALQAMMTAIPVPLRAGDGVHHAQRAVLLFDAGADRARAPDHGSTRRLQTLSGNRGSRPPQSAGAGDHGRAFRGAAALRGRARRRETLVRRLRGGGRRAHPGEADAMSDYQPAWSSGGGWSGRDFGSAVSSSVAGVSGALSERGTSLVRLVGIRRRWRRLGRRWRRRWRRRLVAAASRP